MHDLPLFPAFPLYFLPLRKQETVCSSASVPFLLSSNSLAQHSPNHYLPVDFFIYLPNMLTNIYVYVILNSQDKHTRREKIKNVYEKENGYGEVFG